MVPSSRHRGQRGYARGRALSLASSCLDGRAGNQSKLLRPLSMSAMSFPFHFRQVMDCACFSERLAASATIEAWKVEILSRSCFLSVAKSMERAACIEISFPALRRISRECMLSSFCVMGCTSHIGLFSLGSGFFWRDCCCVFSLLVERNSCRLRYGLEGRAVTFCEGVYGRR